MVDLRARRQLRSLVCGPDSREKQDGRYGVSTEIEGLVSRARELINDREEMLSPDVCYVLHKCADALSQTIPRTTDEGLDDGNSTLLLQARYVLKDLAAKNAGCGYEKMAEACEAAAMCRVSKTDEGRNAVIVDEAMCERALHAVYNHKRDRIGLPPMELEKIKVSEGVHWPVLVTETMIALSAALEAALTTGGK
jgi:hypothetical protein